MIAFNRVRTARRFVLALLLGTCLVSPAWGQKAGKDDARRFFNAGQKAFQAGRYVEAAKAFEEAFRIKPHPFALINAGDAWEKSGDLALAARTFQRVLKLEQSGEQDRADATERLAKLTPKLAIVELEGDASIKARVDQDEFQGGDRVYVTPGEHVVTLVDVEGAKQRKFELAAGASRSVSLAKLRPKSESKAVAAEEEPVEPTEPVSSGDPAPDAPPPSKKPGIRAPTYIAFGVAALAVGGAVYFGLQVNDAEKKYNEKPNRDDFDRFNQNKLLTNVSIGVAAASAALGTYFLIRDTKRPAKVESARGFHGVGIAPLADGALVAGSGRF